MSVAKRYAAQHAAAKKHAGHYTARHAADKKATRRHTARHAAAKKAKTRLVSKGALSKDLGQNAFFLVTVVLMTIYLVWRVAFTLPLHDGLWQAIFGVLLVVAEITTAMTTFELYYRKSIRGRGALELPEILPEDYPDVDVFITTHNEPAALLYKTVNACTFMEYPDPRKVHIYLCDDGNRPEIAQLAAELRVGYLGLAENRHAKSGNLNNALAHTSSPLIATFDADMIPRHTFLQKTVPYFLLPRYLREEDGAWRPRTPDEMDETERIGLIQTPQYFYNLDLFQYNLFAEKHIPNEQDFFSREVNLLRNSSNAAAYTGSNAVISRQAMEEIGGFPLKTITEDFETSIRLQKEGYITYATNEVQASGLSTTNIPAMIRQRTRWGRGVIQSIQNTHAVFTPKLPFSARISYLNAFLYWWSFFNRLIFVLAPILFALFDFRVVNCALWQLLVFWLPSYLFYSTSMRFLSGNLRTQRWSQVIDTIMAPFLIVPVALETLGIHQRRFQITSKVKSTAGAKIIWYALPHILLAALSLAAIVRFVWGKYGMALLYSCVILFWLGYNMVALVYALFFMLGRPSPRQFERIAAQEPLTVQAGGRTIPAVSVDLSDAGMQFHIEQACYFPADEPFLIQMVCGPYRAALSAQLVYVRHVPDGWNYAVRIQPQDESSRRQYAQILYDRPPVLRTEIDPWSTAYDDITRNILRRVQTSHAESRKTPRILLGREIFLEDGAHGYFYDFNYHYFSVGHFVPAADRPDGLYRLCFPDGTVLLLHRTGTPANHPDAELFELLNLDALLSAGADFNELFACLPAENRQTAKPL